MRSVAPTGMSFDESLYANLPPKTKRTLAAATGSASARTSATLLYRTLGTPALVKALPDDQFKSSKNTSGQIKWFTRARLTIRHFFIALFSRFNRFGPEFAKLVNTSLQRSNTSATTPQNRAMIASTGRSRLGNIATDVVGMGGGIALGEVAGNAINCAIRDHRQANQSEVQEQLEAGDGDQLEQQSVQDGQEDATGSVNGADAEQLSQHPADDMADDDLGADDDLDMANDADAMDGGDADFGGADIGGDMGGLDDVAGDGDGIGDIVDGIGDNCVIS